MPLTEKTLEYDGSVDFGLLMYENDHQDDAFLSHISPYNTLRAADLMRRIGQTHKPLQEVIANWTHKPLQEVIANWKKDQPTTDDTKALDVYRLRDEALKDTGLQEHELLVQGFTVDHRITPGFRYKVRRVGESQYLFNGEAKSLQSIGLGYGRRLTFSGDRLNFNECFFWSDSNPSGFAFSLEAIKEGDVFTVTNSQSIPVGEITVDSVDHPQVELETRLENDTIVKSVLVRFTNSVRFYTHHNLLDVQNSQDVDIVEGIAELVKLKGRKEAFVRCIKNVNFPKLGQCNLEAET